MLGRSCCFVAVLCFYYDAAWAQKPSAKFNPQNQAAQVEHVFKDDNFRTVKGNIGQVLPDQKVVLRIEGAAPSVAATTMKPLPRQVQGFALDIDVEKGDDNTVLVNNVRPSLVSAWINSSVSKERLPELDRSVRRLGDNFQKLMESASPSREELKTIADSAHDVHETFLTSYATTPANDTAELNRLARLYPKILEFKRKAIIGFDDNYWPEVYETMYRHSRSVVAIALRGREWPVGTGALIGNNLVLTCSHVFEEPIQQYEVWFDFEETSKGRLTRRVFPIDQMVFEGEAVAALRNQSLDFVLFTIGPDQDGKTCYDLRFQPLPLTKTPCLLDEPVYVIGHPSRAARTVHDNVRVIFPYILSGTRKSELDARVRSEILAFVESQQADPTERTRTQADLLKVYSECFIEKNGEYKYVSTIRGPAIGIDSDTFSGDSGAPMFLRRASGKATGIVAVFVGGVPQGAEKAGWLTHEVALPIIEVIAQLDAQKPNWQTMHGVTVQSP